MSHEDWGFEWESADQPDGQVNLLLIDLADKAIKSQLDCMLLWDEIESIAEDFPGYMPVFVLKAQNGNA